MSLAFVAVAVVVAGMVNAAAVVVAVAAVVVKAASVVVVAVINAAWLCTSDYPSMTRSHYYPFSSLEFPRMMVYLEEPRLYWRPLGLG